MSDEILDRVGREVAQRRLRDALAAVGVHKPEYHAQVLAGRVRADLSQGLDAVQVLTPGGTPAVDERGEPLTVERFAQQFAAENPDFLADNIRARHGPLDEHHDRPRGGLPRELFRRRIEQEMSQKIAAQVRAVTTRKP